MYRKDIWICTIKFCDPWCHGTSDINGTGVTERWTLMPRVIIITFLHSLTCRISLVWTNVFIRWQGGIPGTNLRRDMRDMGICLVLKWFIIAKKKLIRGTKTKLLWREKLSTSNKEVLVSSQLNWSSLSDPVVLIYLLLFAASVGHDQGKSTTKN